MAKKRILAVVLSLLGLVGLPVMAQTPSLESTIEFLDRMAKPENRHILLGNLVEVKTPRWGNPVGWDVSIISGQPLLMVIPVGLNEEGNFRWKIITDAEGDHKAEDYPMYMTFSLVDIDPTSIRSVVGGVDGNAFTEFGDQHPNCEHDQMCVHNFLLPFLNPESESNKLWMVPFHTTDLKPLIWRGRMKEDCSKIGEHGCPLVPIPTDNTGKAVFFFRDKDRAERFVTAFRHAVDLNGGKPDSFPPTPSKQ